MKSRASEEQKTVKRRESFMNLESITKLLRLPCISCPKIIKCVERRELANKCPKLTSYLIDD